MFLEDANERTNGRDVIARERTGSEVLSKDAPGVSRQTLVSELAGGSPEVPKARGSRGLP
jgi:hypothetical protein